MSKHSEVRALKPEFEAYTNADDLYEDDIRDVMRPKVQVSSNPTNPSRRTEGYFRPAHQPTKLEQLKGALESKGMTSRRLLTAGAVASLAALAGVGIINHETGGDTGQETKMFADADLKPLGSKTTKVIIRDGANVRTSPVEESDKSNSTSNIAFSDKNLEVTEGVYYGDWLGFQMDDVQPGENVSPEEAAGNTYWVNIGKLKHETRADGTTFASEYVLDGQTSAQEVPITLGADGVFHDEQNNRVAVAHEIPAA